MEVVQRDGVVMTKPVGCATKSLIHVTVRVPNRQEAYLDSFEKTPTHESFAEGERELIFVLTPAVVELDKEC